MAIVYFIIYKFIQNNSEFNEKRLKGHQWRLQREYQQKDASLDDMLRMFLFDGLYLFGRVRMSGISNFNNQALSVQLEHVRLSEDVDSSQEEQTWKTILMKACHSRREMNQQGIKRAIDIIESILKEHPTPAAHYLLAEAYLYLLPADNQTKIVKAYRDAIELSTKFEEAYRQLGTFHYRCGHYKQALEVYFEWGNHFPKRGEIWRRIGDIFTKLEMKEQACKYLLMAVSNGRKDRIDREQFTLEDQEDMIEYSE